MAIMLPKFKLLQINLLTIFLDRLEQATISTTRVTVSTEILWRQWSQTSNFYRSVFNFPVRQGKITAAANRVITLI